MSQLYFCVYCSMNFLSPASLILIVDAEGITEYIHERGYPAVREVRRILSEKEGSFLRINQNDVKSGMLAETTVNGTAVCMDHCYEAVEAARNSYSRGRFA